MFTPINPIVLNIKWGFQGIHYTDLLTPRAHQHRDFHGRLYEHPTSYMRNTFFGLVRLLVRPFSLIPSRVSIFFLFSFLYVYLFILLA